jgi:hypothetical protein
MNLQNMCMQALKDVLFFVVVGDEIATFQRVFGLDSVG